MLDLATIANLRYHDRSCSNCRYFRIHTTVASVSECLALGRTLGISSAGTDSNWELLLDWSRQRLCDIWARRPGSWVIYSKGTDKNPYFVDPYIKRSTLERLRYRLYLRSTRKARQHGR